MTGSKSAAIASLQENRPQLWGAEVFSELLDSCVEALFRQLGTPVAHANECHTGRTFEQSATIGFESKSVKGSVTLVASRNLLIDSHPSGRHSHTWIGELANLIIGRLKNDFWRYGVEDMRLGIPKIVTGPCSPPSPPEPGDVTHRSYSGKAEHLLCAWAEGRICGEIADHEGIIAARPSMVQPGKLVLF